MWEPIKVEEFKGLKKVATFQRVCWTGRTNMPAQDMPGIATIIGAEDFPLGTRTDAHGEEEPVLPDGCRIFSFAHVVEREDQLYAVFSYGTQHAMIAMLGGGAYRAHKVVFLWKITPEMLGALKVADLMEEDVKDVEFAQPRSVSSSQLPSFAQGHVPGATTIGTVIHEADGSTTEIPGTILRDKQPIEE